MRVETNNVGQEKKFNDMYYMLVVGYFFVHLLNGIRELCTGEFLLVLKLEELIAAVARHVY